MEPELWGACLLRVCPFMDELFRRLPRALRRHERPNRKHTEPLSNFTRSTSRVIIAAERLATDACALGSCASIFATPGHGERRRHLPERDPIGCPARPLSMAARDFDALASGTATNDLMRALGSEATEETQSLASPGRGGNATGQRISVKGSSASSRKYSLGSGEALRDSVLLEAAGTLSDQVKQMTDQGEERLARAAVSSQGELTARGDDFHSVRDSEENVKSAERTEEEEEEEEEEEASGHYQLVKKSIYKPPKKGSILQRLAGMAAGGSKTKYAIPPHDQDAVSGSGLDGIRKEPGSSNGGASSQSRGGEMDDVDLDDPTEAKDANSAIHMEEEEEESIDVSIDRSASEQLVNPPREIPAHPSPIKSPLLLPQQHGRDDVDEYEEEVFDAPNATLQEPPQVVIHSGESDSETGFATLNPVIAARRKLYGPARSAAVVSADASPFLVEIPSTAVLGEQNGATTVASSSILVINALGASELVKVEKFGTQSTLLELQLRSRSSEQRAADHNGQLSVMRTPLHKKGGSEAQWNQQFTTKLESKRDQFVRASVKTNNRMIVGQADVPLDKVGDLLHDQHYPLYRPVEGTTGDASQLPQDGNHDERRGCLAGYVHLQLKIVDSSTGPLSLVAIPKLHLPFPTASEPDTALLLRQKSSIADRIPRELLYGSLLYKVPFHKSNAVGYTASPRRVWVTVIEAASGERLIAWADPTAASAKTGKKGSSSLSLALVTEICEGHKTKAFEDHKASNVVKEKEKCFSLVAKSRTLDLIAASKEEATIWVAGLRGLLFPAIPAGNSNASLTAARTIHDYRHVALSSGHSSSTADAIATDPVRKKQQLAVWRNQLFDLARRNHIDAVASCLRDGCPIDLLETRTGDTLLIIACRVGNAALVELCLSWRAKNDPHPEFGDTALQVAVANRHADCLKLLLLTAAKSDMDSEIVNHIDSNNDAPLHVAARNGDFACLQHLLLHGADICVVDEIGRTPLHCAVSTAQHDGADCVAYLLDVGGDSVLNLGDQEGDTPLHYAALAGNEEAVRLLLGSAADAFATNSNGEMPFDVAVRERHQCCADLIAPYCIKATVDDARDGLAEESVSACSAFGEEIQHDHSNEEREETNASRRQRRRRRHHRRRPVRDVNADEDYDEREYESSSVSEHEVVHDSIGYSSSQYDSSSYDRSIEYHPRSHTASERVYNLSREDTTPNTDLRTLNGRFNPARQGVMTLSASEQIRAALARHQHSLPVVTGGRPPMTARSTFDSTSTRSLSLSLHSSPYSARGESPSRSEQQPLYWVNGQQVATEQLDRMEVDHPTQRSYRINGGGYSGGQLFSASHRTRSRSEDTSRSNWGYQGVYPRWSDYERHPSRADNNSSDSTCSSSILWNAETNAFVPSRSDPSGRRPATAGSVSQDPLWYVLYTEDGYPYYVNRHTGVSQWEKPSEAEIALPLTQSASCSMRAAVRGPDEIIRMRLSQARRQQSVSAPGISAHQTPYSNVVEAFREGESPESDGFYHTSSVTSATYSNEGIASGSSDANTSSGTATVHSAQISPTPLDAPIASEHPQSTYESRTGLKLSIDVESPPSKEHTRPAFVPSPRSKVDSSPSDFDQTLTSGICETTKREESSFQKSRASSPRCRSKNVSLIDLKRANNLAAALASFKIYDQYEQIIDGITNMDETTISASLLACIQRFFPTEQERDALKRFSGSLNTLGKPERFFYLLFQVSSVQTRIEMFLYKLEFGRTHQTLLDRIFVVKRACRDLAENFDFVQAVDKFFSSHLQQRSLVLLKKSRDEFKVKFLADADEKLASFRGDLEKAANFDLTDLQLQLSRLLTGRQTIQAFVDLRDSTASASSGANLSGGDDESRGFSGASDILERFLLETRKSMADVEDEFESMEQWLDKLLAMFGESKVSCRLADVVAWILSLF